MEPSRKSRREALKVIGGGIGALALVACGVGTEDVSAVDGGAGGGGGNAPSDAGTVGAADGGAVAWATAGTSILSGKDYGNPFADGIGPTCTVYKSATEGPCHATSNLLTRRDVSEGYAGLPMRLELLIVDTACAPVPNATVEIWMTDTKGVYSGDTDGNNDAFCTGGDSTAAASLWGRGIQTAGADGRVTFDANFPGWYASRATHIHFKVSVGGTAYLTSQLFFDDAFKASIYDSQPNYRPTSGQGYVRNTNDNVLLQTGMTQSEGLCATRQMSDGALLAWKAITVA